jgi:hypothetical protein
MYLGPIKPKILLSFVLLSLISQFELWRYQLHNLERFKQHEKPRNDHAVQADILTLRAQCHYSVIQLWACVLSVSLKRFQNLLYTLVWPLVWPSTIMDWGSVRSRQRSLLSSFETSATRETLPLTSLKLDAQEICRGFDSHRGQAINFSACLVWMHTQSNITNIIFTWVHNTNTHKYYTSLLSKLR